MSHNPSPLTHSVANVMVPLTMIVPRPCPAYYYGGLPIKGTRRKGRLWVEEAQLFFQVPASKKGEKIDLTIPFPRMEKISLTRDNYYGSDTVLFNLTFRDQGGKTFTLRFAPVTIVPRRRIALQQQWFNFLTEAIPSSQ